MTRDEALIRVRSHELELRAAGVCALYLFGSTARDEARPDSDVDFLCELDDTKKISLLDFIDVKLRLEDLLHSEVDLVERAALRHRMRARVEREAVRVF